MPAATDAYSRLCTACSGDGAMDEVTPKIHRRPKGGYFRPGYARLSLSLLDCDST